MKIPKYVNVVEELFCVPSIQLTLVWLNEYNAFVISSPKKINKNNPSFLRESFCAVLLEMQLFLGIHNFWHRCNLSPFMWMWRSTFDIQITKKNTQK